MSKKPVPTSVTSASISLRTPFVWVSLFFFGIIIVNVIGYFLIANLNSQREYAQKIADLIHQQKIAYTQFSSASSNSVIGLATNNWNLLLDERKIITAQIEKFETLGIEIKDALNGFGNESVLENHYQTISEQWLDLKRQNVAILRSKSSDLEKNEALPEFVASAKRLKELHENYESLVLKTLTERQHTVNATSQYISFTNFGFQILCIPFLIFAVFKPSLKRAQELEFARAQNLSLSRLSTLGEMAGGVAHEINTPLAVITLSSQQALDILDNEILDKEILRKMLLAIDSTSERIAKIVRGLKAFSRDGSNDPLSAVSVSTLIEDTLSLCRDRFKQQAVDLKVEGDLDDVWLIGRATELSQVLLNLLNNAFDAVVGSATPWVTVSVVSTKSTVELRVTDSGKGIPENIRSKLFQPFFTTKAVGSGTGMGLSISLGILKSHDGNLVIDEKCVNTRFVMQLPHKKKALKTA